MLRHPRMPRLSPGARRAARIVAALGLASTALGPLAGATTAAETPTMEARVLLGGHARVGEWVAIAVHLKNDGPAVSGELRITGGTQSQTRFGTAVDLPTQSDKTYVIYAQPPAFGSQFEIVLAENDKTVVSTKTKFVSHEGTQLIVAVVAEHPEGIVGSLNLPPNVNQVAPLVMSIPAEDLPERVEAWNALDRVVWQDID